jgi:DNA-binding IclR family transcriptional regulator
MKAKRITGAPPPARSKAARLSGMHQGITRPAAVLDALARAASPGLRLTDIVHATGLGKATVHRLLVGLTACRLVEQDEQSGRFFVGSRVLAWAAAASDRFGLTRSAEPAMLRLAQATLDTIYLAGREGDEAVCLARREGAHPIKTLTLNIGDRRPLGVSAGGMALLAFLSDAEVDRILDLQAAARIQLPFDQITLRRMIGATRRSGFAYYDAPVIHGTEVVTGMAAVAVPIRRSEMPIAALSVAAIAARLDAGRRMTIVNKLTEEAGAIEAAIAPAILAASVARP